MFACSDNIFFLWQTVIPRSTYKSTSVLAPSKAPFSMEEIWFRLKSTFSRLGRSRNMPSVLTRAIWLSFKILNGRKQKCQIFCQVTKTIKSKQNQNLQFSCVERQFTWYFLQSFIGTIDNGAFAGTFSRARRIIFARTNFQQVPF